MYKNYFFDFDGTIFDSYDHSTTAFINVIKKTRGIILDYKKVYFSLKLSFADCFDTFKATKDEIELFKIEYKRNDFFPLVIPYKDTLELFKYLYNKGFNIFMYTNRDKQTLEYLKQYDLLKYVKDSILAGMFKGKPNPEALNYMVDKHHLNKNECLVIGDRSLDVDGAYNASIDGLLIDEFDTIEDENATYEVNNLTEAFKLIKKLNGD